MNDNINPAEHTVEIDHCGLISRITVPADAPDIVKQYYALIAARQVAGVRVNGYEAIGAGLMALEAGWVPLGGNVTYAPAEAHAVCIDELQAMAARIIQCISISEMECAVGHVVRDVATEIGLGLHPIDRCIAALEAAEDYECCAVISQDGDLEALVREMHAAALGPKSDRAGWQRRAAS